MRDLTPTPISQRACELHPWRCSTPRWTQTWATYWSWPCLICQPVKVSSGDGNESCTQPGDRQAGTQWRGRTGRRSEQDVGQQVRGRFGRSHGQAGPGRAWAAEQGSYAAPEGGLGVPKRSSWAVAGGAGKPRGGWAEPMRPSSALTALMPEYRKKISG